MNGSIASGLNLVHHYLNTSFSREFRCDDSLRVSQRDITVKWMYTNLQQDHKEIWIKRLGQNKPLGEEQEFLDWWPILREPHGFHIMFEEHFTCLTIWKKEDCSLRKRWRRRDSLLRLDWKGHGYSRQRSLGRLLQTQRQTTL